MANKSPLTKSLETAQKNAIRELASTRKRIRKQSKVSAYEYAVLHEDSLDEAKRGADRIDKLFKLQAELGREPTLVLVSESEGSDRLVLAVTTCGLELLSNGWKLQGTRYIAWDDSRPGSLQTMEVKEIGPIGLLFTAPLHRVLSGPETFFTISESDVAQRLLPIEKREGGRRDRFNFFYSLTNKLGYELKDKKLKKRVEEERERVAAECQSHLKSLAGVFDQFFVHGAHPPYHNFKGDASPMLLSRAKELATSMRSSMHECKLYGVDTEESREIAAFGKRWITYFNLGD